MSSATIIISQPCREDWAAMTPTATGRHCAACRKVVVDFTEKTDAELLAYFWQTTRADTCGRFRAAQVGRPLQPAETTSRWRSWLGAALALGGVLGSGRAVAQSSANFHPGPVPAEATSQVAADPATAPKPAVELTFWPGGAVGPLLVRGVVRDAATDQGLPGVTLLLAGTTQGTSTNMDGEFELHWEGPGPPPVLQASYVGYMTQEVSAAEVAAPCLLSVALHTDIKGGISFQVAPPAPWHPRALYHWGQYWLTRPFRR